MKLGFIGVGNMGGAILGGVVRSGFLPPQSLLAYDASEAQLASVRERYQVESAGSVAELVTACDAVLLCVKPVYLRDVLLEARPHARGKSFISIAAGWTLRMLTDILDAESGARVLRVMPNTPALVGEGFIALCRETTVDDETFAWAE